MATIANLVLANGAATPVNKTFTPEVPYRGTNQPAVWVLKEGVAPLAHPRVEIGMSRNGNRTRRVGYKVTVPYAVDNGDGPVLVSKALYDSNGGGFIIPENATQAQIDDLYAFVSNLNADAMFALWVTTGEPAY